MLHRNMNSDIVIPEAERPVQWRASKAEPLELQQHGNGAASRFDLAAFFACAFEGPDDVNAPAKFERTLPDKLVVIGNGMAGCRAVEELLARDPERYAITMF